jgi:hypothetical protein
MTITKLALLSSLLAFAGAASAGAQQAPALKFLTAQDAREQVATDVIGMDVTGVDGTRYGKITDLLLDEQNHLAGAVMAVGGFLGLGTKKIALRWQDISIVDDERPHAVLAVSEEELASAPDFKTLIDLREERADQERRDRTR